MRPLTDEEIDHHERGARISDLSSVILESSVLVLVADLRATRAELAKVRAKSEERRRLLEEVHESLTCIHQSQCVPTWTAYDRHAPGTTCEDIEAIAAALKD